MVHVYVPFHIVLDCKAQNPGRFDINWTFLSLVLVKSIIAFHYISDGISGQSSSGMALSGTCGIGIRCSQTEMSEIFSASSFPLIIWSSETKVKGVCFLGQPANCFTVFHHFRLFLLVFSSANLVLRNVDLNLLPNS